MKKSLLYILQFYEQQYDSTVANEIFTEHACPGSISIWVKQLQIQEKCHGAIRVIIRTIFLCDSEMG
jgi:hypothetical protein